MQGTRANAESAYYNTDGAGAISQAVSRHSYEHIPMRAIANLLSNGSHTG